ncbi:Glucooligosaccharide oxidase [Aaosphaeria arxii CBS 175.79]|uniref:Glucooligosaccharide oxidase n=1 Tax=Aaosphaeria arxii CBS 175.79 TaxID=1450172 RepID=A0A6A5XTP3_9PLEO|nr:Glucooligosaccharide oxidase [Aaosphaeria arxii CBS 175.79]KAF2016725.1 Glucooligosaccharide oxidase [Aaosphaeria arxii CBS 175.79]
MRTSAVVASLLSIGLTNALSVRATVTSCLNSKNVPYLMASSPGYADYAEPFNLALPYKPIAIVLPNTSKHVQDAVKCASNSNVKVQAKSGGHSYASFSSGGKDGSLVINLEPFQKVELDKSTKIAKVGGGVRLGNLAQGIWDQGKRALPHGTCPGVGIGGHFTHGGYGHTSRHWGVALDTIVGLDVVLADGRLVHATKSENAEIFWALRGAADSFGVITNFYLQTNAAPDSITYWSFAFASGIYEQKSNFVNTWLHIQDFARNASIIDDRISFGNYLDGTGFSVSGAFFGSVDEFNTKIKPEFLRTLATPSSTTVKSYQWIDYLTLVSDKTTIVTPPTGYDDHDDFFAKSITVPEKSGWSKASLEAWYDTMKAGSPTPYFVITNLYGGPGSKINNKDTTFAAYSERDSIFVSQLYGSDTGAEARPFINKLHSAIVSAAPSTEFGAYLNYVDPSLDPATAHQLYYGEPLYQKLLALKKKYDPKSVFWNPQAIGT